MPSQKKKIIKNVDVDSTQETLKSGYYNYKSSFAHEIYRHITNLSKYVWEIKKNQGIDPILKWEIVKNLDIRQVINIGNYAWRKN